MDEKYEYVQPIGIDELLYCVKCNVPVIKPVVLHCGHLICYNCIPNEFWTEDNYICFCTKCNLEYNSKSVSLIIEKYITDLLNNINVNCLRCHSNQNIKRFEYNNHLQNECRVACEFGCGAMLLKGEINEHNTKCNYYPLECKAKDYNCEWVGRRIDYQNHISNCVIVKIAPVIKGRDEKIEYLMQMNAVRERELNESNELLLKFMSHLVENGNNIKTIEYDSNNKNTDNNNDKSERVVELSD